MAQAQCVSGASYIVTQRPLLRRQYSPLIVSGVSSATRCPSIDGGTRTARLDSRRYVVASLITFLVGGAYFALMSQSERADVRIWENTPLFGGVLAFCVLATTVYNYVVIAWVTGQLGATVVTCGTILQGIFSAAIEWIVFQKPISAAVAGGCLLYTSPSPRDRTRSRMPSSA